MSEPTQQPTQQLPGYRLIEKIGEGGYGEVWSAEAPGGLMKAIKYVFGDQLEKRASHEMHALGKVKEVRHPFLLSLERIEVIDGRLLVLTELADSSLRDRFRECIEQGLPGIPREELLGYLQEAANALDFLNTKHDLAHLDIKPENLLIVAGHVKVADYGLVKSIGNQTQASLVGGMTPAYAAPEVFRGVPARQSDQYSLAIMYQELLTGGLPFPGVNAAELTLQHLNHDPDLSRLSEGDRFAISRALAKDAEFRYESATEFVKSLASSSGDGTTFSATTPESAASPRPTLIVNGIAASRHSATEVFGETMASQTSANTKALLMQLAPLAHPDAVEVAMPVVDSNSPFTPTPALFIGIGGTGGKVLRAVRKLTNERLGVQGPVATLPMLLIDTDAQSLASATRGNELSGRLEASETLALPLRKPQQYREKANFLLRWLGRRWLYNIPRSLMAEGIRPLGRLALVDHARRTFQRIRGLVTDAVSEQALGETLEETGTQFQDSGLRVYIVASASGGTGSGMTLDIAYGVRSILERMGIEKTSITGIIAHSTYRDASRAELARVNAYAWLSEMNQFASNPDGYPGDEGCGLPAHSTGVPAFDNTYFVPLGEQLDNADYESATGSIAEYLVADVLTPLQTALDSCRQEEIEEKGISLRSFAVTRSRTANRETLGPDEVEVVQQMLKGWMSEEPSQFDKKDSTQQEKEVHSTDQVVHGAVAFIGRTQLDSVTLASNCRTLIEASLGGDAGAFIGSRLEKLESKEGPQMMALVDQLFLPSDGGDQPAFLEGAAFLEGKPLDELTRPLFEKLQLELSGWVLGQVNNPSERLSGAGRAAKWSTDHLSALHADLLRLGGVIDAEIQRFVEGWEVTGIADACSRREKYFGLRLDQAALASAIGVVESLLKVTHDFPKEIEVLNSLLVELANQFVSHEEEVKGSLFEISDSERRQLVVALEERMQEEYLDSTQGLLGSLATDESAAELKRTLEHAVRLVIEEVLPTLESQQTSNDDQHAAFSKPDLCRFGGEYRHVALTPANADIPFRIKESLNGVTTIEDSMSDCLLVTEATGASLPHTAADLIRCRRDYAAFAERARTRRDVSWVDPVGGANAVEPSPAIVSQPFPTAALV